MKPIAAFVLGLVALPILGLIAAVLGLLPSKATPSPPQWEAGIAMRALDASLEKRAKGVTNPIEPGDILTLADGAKLYQQQCSGCHGDAKGPSCWGTNDFSPRVPQFYQMKGNDLTPEEAFVAIHDGIRYSGMAAWGDQIPNSDIWKLANFVPTIRRAEAPCCARPPKS
jgi:mono/diheme cytochrome c family protein